MSRHVVIGTAGHVDHGKTALVRALTGVDTDRWEEEKRRGITIDLGFAPLDLGGDLTASIVDVPGHEDFVRNMVAGATGVDVALLVVAADESVMPQTVEHVAILDALGVRAGVVAVTKTDLVDGAWLDLVESEVRERLASSGLVWHPPVRVSAVQGTGLDALRAALAAAAAGAPDRRVDDLFRMPVDRAFSVAGAGTVVTGTVWSGSVRVGDDVTILPEGRRARVRGVQVHGVAREAAVPGRRTALALVGVDRQAVGRGATIVSGQGWRNAEALDVIITLLPTAKPLGQRSRVRLHLGTAEVLARVTPAGSTVEPGGSAEARLRLETSFAARWGDRGVLRSYSPTTTIGGCIVLDPWPRARPRRPAGLAELARDDVARVAAAVKRAGARGLPLTDLDVRLGLPPARVSPTVDALPRREIVRIGDRLFEAGVVREVRDAVRDALARFHRSEPLAAGMSLEALRTEVGDARLADAAVDALRAEGQVTVEGATVRLSTHVPARAAEVDTLVSAVGNALQQAGSEGRTLPELAEFGDARRLSPVVEYLVREKAIVRISAERLIEAGALERMIGVVAGLLAEGGEVELPQLRDKLGLTRKYLIPFVEWLDAQGYTVRQGDTRRAGPRLTRSSGAA